MKSMKTETHDGNKMTIEVMNRLFESIQRICPAFKQAWPSQTDYDGAKIEWLKAFRDAQISDVSMIKAALAKFRLQPTPFVPSVGQFIALCMPTPEEMGIPSLDDALKQAAREMHPQSNQSWSHPVVYQAAVETGRYELSLPTPVARRRFKKNYDKAMRDFLSGKLNDRLPKQVQFKSSQYRRSKAGESALKEIMDSLGRVA